MKMLMATSKVEDGPMGSTINLTPSENENRLRFIRAHFGDSTLLPVMIESAHGNNIHIALVEDAGTAMPNCDGLIAAVPNLPLMVTHQDCVPIVISDDLGSFVCVLHAGWRGVIAGIMPKAIELIRERFSLGNLGLYFGPGIGPCHFEVEEDVAGLFSMMTSESVIERDGKLFVDMHTALLAQATSCGVDEKQIVMSGDCTFYDKSYASWRRDGVAEANMVTVAMLVK